MFYKLWGGRISYQDALITAVVRVEGIPKLTRAFPQWFGWADVMPAKSSTPAPARMSGIS